MDEDFYVLNYDLIKSSNTKNKKFKFKDRKFKPLICFKNDNQTISLNVNKNKNWNIEREYKNKIRDDPECGVIKRSKNQTEIQIFKSGTKIIEESLIFSKDKIYPREDRTCFKNGVSLLSYKKTYHKKSDLKKLKVRAKRQIILESDFIVNKPIVSTIKTNYFINSIISNLSILVKNVTNNGIVSLQPLYESEMSQENKITEVKKELTYHEVINIECPICCNPSCSGLVLENCKHGCCLDCWKNYVNSFNPVNELKCCFPNCNEKLNLNFLQLLLPETKFESYKLIYSKVKSCPNECGKIFVSNSKKLTVIKCNCGYSGCNVCNLEPHFPISCEKYQFYKQNFENEELNGKKSASTSGKFCPSCKVFIEKNGGCSHMRCVCGLDFCWECLKGYSFHKICVPVNEFKMTFNNWEEKAIKYSIMFYQFRSLVQKTSEINLGHRHTLGKTISKDVLDKNLRSNIEKKWTVNQKSFGSFLDNLINNLFNIVQEASVIAGYLFSSLIFSKLNKVNVDYAELILAKKLENWLKLFNRIFMEKFDLNSFHVLILLCKRILNALNKFKN